MCEALPGPRCSNHAAKRMIANRMKRDKSRQKIQELNSQINKAYSDCDINRATTLLEKMTEEEEKCQDLESNNIEFTQVWYTTEKGIEYLDQKIEDAEDPKTKSTIKQTRDKALETKEKQDLERSSMTWLRPPQSKLLRKEEPTSSRLKMSMSNHTKRAKT